MGDGPQPILEMGTNSALGHLGRARRARVRADCCSRGWMMMETRNRAQILLKMASRLFITLGRNTGEEKAYAQLMEDWSITNLSIMDQSGSL